VQVDFYLGYLAYVFFFLTQSLVIFWAAGRQKINEGCSFQSLVLLCLQELITTSTTTQALVSNKRHDRAASARLKTMNRNTKHADNEPMPIFSHC